jgi:hypothetical protein
VPADLTARLFALARDLLGRTLFPEYKVQPGYFWGTPGDESRSVRPRDINGIEGYHVHLAQPRPIAVGPLPPPSGDDDDDDTTLLGDLMAKYGDHMARRLFDAIATSQDLDADRTTSYLNEHGGYVRAGAPVPAVPGVRAQISKESRWSRDRRRSKQGNELSWEEEEQR